MGGKAGGVEKSEPKLLFSFSQRKRRGEMKSQCGWGTTLKERSQRALTNNFQTEGPDNQGEGLQKLHQVDRTRESRNFAKPTQRWVNIWLTARTLKKASVEKRRPKRRRKKRSRNLANKKQNV